MRWNMCFPARTLRTPIRPPILEVTEIREAGDYLVAYRKLMSLLVEDLRSLHAQPHVDNFVFDYSPVKAIRHL
jgi:hypothetical protein